MRRLVLTVAIAAAGAVAFQGEVPQALKPAAYLDPNGTLKGVPLQSKGDADAPENTPLKRPEEGRLSGAPDVALPASLLYTAAAKYDRDAWMKGGERFPAGAQVLLLDGGKSRLLVEGFAATADANVSFDGTRVLFAGKKTAKDAWQVWEVPLAGGEAKQITACAGDCVRPFFLPGGFLVYAAMVQGRLVLERGQFETGKTLPLPLSHAPGNAMPTDILRDGRILFEAAYPMGNGKTPEIYTVYSDGSGVEAYRCDHGWRREAGKQAASGDIVFASDKGIGRFTSALAHQVEMKAPAGEYAGDAVQVGANEFVVAWRPDGKARWSLVSWNAKDGTNRPLAAAVGEPLKRPNQGRLNGASGVEDLVQPVIVQRRAVPNQHPSGLHDWAYANLLCLNAYTSKYGFAPGSVESVRLYTTDEKGKAKLLGMSPVEKDGSFYVQVPGDKPLQIELVDAQGKTLKREQGWWWLAQGEQRICVGCHAGPERAPENAVPQVLVKSIKPVVMTGAVAASKGGK